jgi:predicted acetyltransferase
MPHVELVPIQPDDRPALARLLQLYLHDFSELLGELPRADGRFDAGPLEGFGGSAGQHAFLIRSDGALAGFALAAQGSRVSGDPAAMDVAEFFVVRGARRKRVGASAARALFALLPGTGEVRVLLANERALAFWREAVGAFARAGFEESSWTAPSGRTFTVLRFASPRGELPCLELVPFQMRFQKACEELIAALPDWFGIPESNASYARDLARLPSWVAVRGDALLGAATLGNPAPAAFEIQFMAVQPEQHRRGIGRALVARLEAEARQRGGRWLHVKTLAPSHPDPFYARTRAFYQALGFEPLFESATLWNADNPAWILVKRL